MHVGLTERGGSYELPYGQAECSSSQGGKRREDVWTAVSERKERNTGRRLAETQVIGDGGEVWTEEIGCCDTDKREEESENAQDPSNDE